METNAPHPGLPPEKLQELLLNKAAATEAAKAPFPGPLRKAFTTPLTKTVGPFKVRPFFDGDYDILAALEHPLQLFLSNSLSEDAWGKKLKTIRGQDAWNLCHLFTTPAAASFEILANEENLAKFKIEARDRFSTFQLSDLVLIQTVVFDNYLSCYTTVAELESIDDSKKKLSLIDVPPLATDGAGCSASAPS